MLETFNNWRLARKMLVAFALIGVVVAGLGVAAVLFNRSIAETGNRHITRGLPTSNALGRIQSLLRDDQLLIYSHATSAGVRTLAGIDRQIERNHAALDAEIERLATIAGADFAGDIDALKEHVAALRTADEDVLELSRRQRDAEALASLKGRDAADYRQTMAVAERLAARSMDRSRQAGIEADQIAFVALLMILLFALAAIAVLGFLWHMMNRTVSRPMAELSDTTTTLAAGGTAHVPHRERADELGDIARAVESFRQAAIARQEADRKQAEDQKLVTEKLAEGLTALAQGDLTAEVKIEFPPESASLKSNFNEALGRLREMIGSVSESATGIRTGSTEIAQAAEDLARRTEGNAASLEETSAALVQIDDRLKATATAAGKTVERADQAIATVSGGRAIADEAVQAMERVRESATGIDSVIEGLDKIAFQTRVLAMNAAVEAGRAGDAGRGFAVVADLVSSLAMRAEEEAKRARDQLTVTQTDIVTAVEAVQRVDGALADISGDVGEVHTLLGGMATDNQAQSSALTQISVAISSMDQSTQQNAAMVEQTSAAARNLTTEITGLAEQAALFKVDKAARPAGGRRAKAAAIHVPSSTAQAAYVSPVKPLPVSSMAHGAAQLNGADGKDWSDF